MQSMKSWEDRVNYVVGLLKGTVSFSSTQIAEAAKCFYQKLVVGDQYKPTSTFSGQVTLISAKDNFVTLSKDYGLNPVSLKLFL